MKLDDLSFSCLYLLQFLLGVLYFLLVVMDLVVSSSVADLLERCVYLKSPVLFHIPLLWSAISAVFIY